MQDDQSTKSKAKKDKKSSKASSELDEVQDLKKKLKIVKQALLETRQQKEDAEQTNAKLTQQVKNLEAQYSEAQNKYLKQYDENEQLSETIQDLQEQLVANGISLCSQKTEKYDISKETDHETAQKITRELQLQHEKEISGLTKLIKQAEKEIEQCQLETNHYKHMCTDLAEKVEKVTKQRDQSQQETAQARDDLRKWKEKMSEYEVRIGQVQQEKSLNEEEKLELERAVAGLKVDIMTRERWNAELQGDILLLKDEIKGRDEIIGQLQQTIVKKGQQHQRLSELIGQFKNQMIIDQIFEQKFGVIHIAQVGTRFEYNFQFVRQKVAEGEFWLQIDLPSQPNQKPWTINVIDIEAIEPVHGCRFELRYLKAQSYFSKVKTLKTETYESKYLAEILDCFDQVNRMIDEQTSQLEALQKQQQGRAKPSQGLLTQRLKEAEEAIQDEKLNQSESQMF